MRIALGCMRLSTDPDADEARARAVIGAALDAGIVLFDTARAYGENERVLGSVLRERAASASRVRVVTKCGMRRDGEAWIPDGRATSIVEDAKASVEALGRPIDVLLLHAPDPRVALATSVRALASVAESGAARAIGLSNVGVMRLEEAARVAPIALVEVALGAGDDEAARGGVVAWCAERGVEVLAHSPLGGPKRAPKLAHDTELRRIAVRLGATPAELVLAYLGALSPSIVPVVGARRVESLTSALRATELALDEEALGVLDARFPGLSLVRRPRAAPVSARADVVVLMGIAGAGKSRAAEAWVARGYERLNRDALGGTLAGIARRLEGALRGGAHGVVLDNTYVTRASRSEVVRVAHENGASVRCVFVDTPPAEAQVNLASRMLERHGALLAGDELKKASKRDPGLFGPGALFRMVRELEPPSPDEGFVAIDVMPFVREHAPGGRPGVAIALDALPHVDAASLPRGAPVLVFGWRPGGGGAPPDVSRIRASVDADVECAFCTHPAGPPICWCRPPLPGLWVAFARRFLLDPRTSVMLGASTAHRTMARALGIRYADAKG